MNPENDQNCIKIGPVTRCIHSVINVHVPITPNKIQYPDTGLVLNHNKERCQKHPEGGYVFFCLGKGLKISTKNGGRVDISNKQLGEAQERKVKMGGG